MIKELLLIMLGGMIVNNIAFEKLLGVCPVIGGKTTSCKAFTTGAAIAVVMLVVALICWPLQKYVLDAFSLGALQIFLYVLVVFIVTYLFELIVKAECKESLGLYFPVIALNAAVLGLALLNAADGLNFLETVFAAAGAGLGYMLAMWLFAGVQSRIQQKYVPAAFKGLPISVLAAAIISMALLAFK